MWSKPIDLIKNSPSKETRQSTASNAAMKCRRTKTDKSQKKRLLGATRRLLSTFSSAALVLWLFSCQLEDTINPLEIQLSLVYMIWFSSTLKGYDVWAVPRLLQNCSVPNKGYQGFPTIPSVLTNSRRQFCPPEDGKRERVGNGCVPVRGSSG